jgi:hypothetical protein
MPNVKAARLRAYNVGFGDCLLLMLDYDDGSLRSILIDFGSTRTPDGAPADHMDRLAGNIAEQTRGHLEMVVATHRHADHISGFGGPRSGAIIAGLQPQLVVQPWTEDPQLATGATAPAVSHHLSGHLHFVRTLAGMQAFAEGLELASLVRQSRLPPDIGSRLSFLGETNITNPAAVEALMKLGERRRYVRFGDDLETADLLPGVQIDVLGPPTLGQEPEVAHQAQVHQEFWSLAAAWPMTDDSRKRACRPGRPKSLFPQAVLPGIPYAARWLTPKIDRVQADELMSLLSIMDDVLNNTSVILLIRINDTSLLFPGDAQIENWSYALFDAPNHETIQRRLSKTNLYKVGDHGSLNATPKTLWRNFANKCADHSMPALPQEEPGTGDLITVLSTLAGQHGDPERHTEVPRQTLLTELAAHSTLRNTDDGTGTLWVDRDALVDVQIPLTHVRPQSRLTPGKQRREPIVHD